MYIKPGLTCASEYMNNYIYHFLKLYGLMWTTFFFECAENLKASTIIRKLNKNRSNSS